MENKIQQQVIQAFATRYGQQPALVVRAPGRVNLIGEHTDYNDGFVMPLAIESAVWIALRPTESDSVTLRSLDFEEPATFDLGNEPEKGDSWVEYPKAVAVMLQRSGYTLKGWEGVCGSDVPIGAGLSSSAALEMAVARAFSAVSGFEWDAPTMARIGQQAENHWVGVNCGIMDQMISATGQEGCAVLIDCRSLELRAEPLPTGTSVVILDTATRRELVDSKYNERRKQCEDASAHFGVKVLRDVSVETFAQHEKELEEMTCRRARHVITENDRTVRAADAMRQQDATLLGTLMDASHESLQHDFEVTNDALNDIVNIAREQDGCFGARMTGAGFGGCAVALVDSSKVDAFVANVDVEYEKHSGREPKIYVTSATEGANIVKS